MPCNKYKSPKKRKLCYLTKEWKDFSKVKNIKIKKLKLKSKPNIDEIIKKGVKKKK